MCCRCCHPEYRTALLMRFCVQLLLKRGATTPSSHYTLKQWVLKAATTTTLRLYCDLQGRKINFTNSQSLVGWSMSRPTVSRVTVDLPECTGLKIFTLKRKSNQKMKNQKNQKHHKKNTKIQKINKSKKKENKKRKTKQLTSQGCCGASFCVGSVARGARKHQNC